MMVVLEVEGFVPSGLCRILLNSSSKAIIRTLSSEASHSKLNNALHKDCVLYHVKCCGPIPKIKLQAILTGKLTSQTLAAHWFFLSRTELVPHKLT